MNYLLKNIDVKVDGLTKDGHEYFFTFSIKSLSDLKENILHRTIFIPGRHESVLLDHFPDINFINFCYAICKNHIINEVERGLVDPNRSYNFKNEEPSDFPIIEFIQDQIMEINSRVAISRIVWEDMKGYILDRLKKENRFITTSGELKSKFGIGLPFSEHDIFYNDLLRYCKEDKVNFSLKTYYREENEPQISFDIEFSS